MLVIVSGFQSILSAFELVTNCVGLSSQRAKLLMDPPCSAVAVLCYG
jgi:hypothetical protein